MPGAPHTLQGPDPPRAGQCAVGGHTGDLVGGPSPAGPDSTPRASALVYFALGTPRVAARPGPTLPSLSLVCSGSHRSKLLPSFPLSLPHANFSAVPRLPCLGLGAPLHPLTACSNPLTTVLLLQPQILLFLPTLSFNVFIPQGSAQCSPPPGSPPVCPVPPTPLAYFSRPAATHSVYFSSVSVHNHMPLTSGPLSHISLEVTGSGLTRSQRLIDSRVVWAALPRRAWRLLSAYFTELLRVGGGFCTAV